MRPTPTLDTTNGPRWRPVSNASRTPLAFGGTSSAFERAELATEAAERRRLLTFAIVGGGATGVEMAGAISEVARQSLAKDFRRIDPTTARIVLIEAGPRILPTLPKNLSIMPSAR